MLKCWGTNALLDGKKKIAKHSSFFFFANIHGIRSLLPCSLDVLLLACVNCSSLDGKFDSRRMKFFSTVLFLYKNIFSNKLSKVDQRTV